MERRRAIPKIIEHLREEILKTGRKILLDEGYHALTMRRIAAENKIAVGTVYNYYESKDVLTAHIMLEDWMKVQSVTNTELANVTSCMEGIRTLYEGMCRFTATYEGTWKEYGDMPPMYGERHLKLIGQISDLIRLLMKTFGHQAEPDPSVFLAEVLLQGATKRTDFSAYEPFIQKLI